MIKFCDQQRQLLQYYMIENAKLLKIEKWQDVRDLAHTMSVFLKLGNCREAHSTSGYSSIPGMDIITFIDA